MNYADSKPANLAEYLDQATGFLQQIKDDGRLFLELEQSVAEVLLRPAAHMVKAAKARLPEVLQSPATRQAPATPRPAAAHTPQPTRPAPVAATPPPPLASLPDSLEEIAGLIATCTRCPLHQSRKRSVPGVGCLNPDIMFIGEGPGKDEDAQGIPFVGRAGELLTRLIIKMGYTRETVFIGNIAKCRPTVNNEGSRDRPPTNEEMSACLPYLKKQIALLKPKVLVLLGNTALDGLFGMRGITQLRGKWLTYEGIPTMPTYHPSYLLRNGGVGAGNKAFWEVWEDMTAVLQKIGKEVPKPGRVS